MLQPNCSEHSRAVEVTRPRCCCWSTGWARWATPWLALDLLLPSEGVEAPTPSTCSTWSWRTSLLASCLPFHARLLPWDARAGAWGRASCQALLFLRALCTLGRAFLTAVTLDRYLRVVHSRLRVNAVPSGGKPEASRPWSGCSWLCSPTRSALLSDADCPSSEPRKSPPSVASGRGSLLRPVHPALRPHPVLQRASSGPCELRGARTGSPSCGGRRALR